MVLASDQIFKTFKTFNNIYTVTRMMALRRTVAPFFRQCRYRSKNKNMLGYAFYYLGCYMYSIGFNESSKAF